MEFYGEDAKAAVGFGKSMIVQVAGTQGKVALNTIFSFRAYWVSRLLFLYGVQVMGQDPVH